MDDRSHQRNREVELEVLCLVPEQRGDPVAIGDAQVGESGREPSGALSAFAKSRAAHGAVVTTGHDGAPRIQSLGTLDLDCQRQLKVVHHQAVHDRFLAFVTYFIPRRSTPPRSIIFQVGAAAARVSGR